MNFSNLIRQHWAALRALLALTVITGVIYPLVVWGIAQLPGLHDKAEGSILSASGKVPRGGRQQADRAVVHRQGRQPAAAVLPKQALGGRGGL